jgi:ribosomal-protein-alanine N-acetyltransferase
MDVDVSAPKQSDAREFIAAAQASRPLHQPWLDAPDTPARFAAYLDRAGRDDQAAYLLQSSPVTAARSGWPGAWGSRRKASRRAT